MPGREAKFVRVLRPGVSAAALRNDRAERGIGQHIDPRRRSHLTGREADDVFVAVARETAETVLKNQLARGRRRGRIDHRGTGGRQCRNQRLEDAALFELVRERSVLIVQDDPGGGLQQHAIVIRNLFETPDENAARFVQHLRFNAGRNQIGDLVMQRLAINRNVFVQNDQLDGQPFRAPVGVRLDQAAGRSRFSPCR